MILLFIDILLDDFPSTDGHSGDVRMNGDERFSFKLALNHFVPL